MATLPFERRRRPILPDCTSKRVEIATLLHNGSHEEVLRAAFRHVPQGFRGVLGRSGPVSHPRCYYQLLKHLLDDDRHQQLAKAVRHLKVINLTRLVVGYILPDDLVHPDLLDRVRDIAEARDVANAIKVLRSRVLDSAAFENGLRSLRRRGDVREYCEAWVQRCEFAPSPISASDRYRPIVDGETLKRKALEYRNCSRSYAMNLLEGSGSLAEFVTDDGSAMIMLARKNDEWFLDEIYGHQNREVDETVRTKAIDYLRVRGIVEQHRSVRKETPYSSLRRLLPRGRWI